MEPQARLVPLRVFLVGLLFFPGGKAGGLFTSGSDASFGMGCHTVAQNIGRKESAMQWKSLESLGYPVRHASTQGVFSVSITSRGSGRADGMGYPRFCFWFVQPETNRG